MDGWMDGWMDCVWIMDGLCVDCVSSCHAMLTLGEGRAGEREGRGDCGMEWNGGILALAYV